LVEFASGVMVIMRWFCMACVGFAFGCEGWVLGNCGWVYGLGGVLFLVVVYMMRKGGVMCSGGWCYEKVK
jgi:hypothetical protein